MPPKLHTIYLYSAFKLIGDNVALLFVLERETSGTVLCTLVLPSVSMQTEFFLFHLAQPEIISKLSIFNCLSTERHVGLQLRLHG